MLANHPTFFSNLPPPNNSLSNQSSPTHFCNQYLITTFTHTTENKYCNLSIPHTHFPYTSPPTIRVFFVHSLILTLIKVFSVHHQCEKWIISQVFHGLIQNNWELYDTQMSRYNISRVCRVFYTLLFLCHVRHKPIVRISTYLQLRYSHSITMSLLLLTNCVTMSSLIDSRCGAMRRLIVTLENTVFT